MIPVNSVNNSSGRTKNNTPATLSQQAALEVPMSSKSPESSVNFKFALNKVVDKKDCAEPSTQVMDKRNN